MHGRNGAVYLTSGAGSAVNIVEAKGWSIDFDYDLVEDNALGDTSKTYLRGLSFWSGSFDVGFDTAQATLFNAATGATSAQPLYLYPDRASTSRYYSGTVWPKLSVSAPIDGQTTATVAFTGDGAFAAA